ncbi:MAG: hypothetical protein BWY76_00786 [bacterium ADurb.Bin429]|nr:MAG: hypothetical protein BWY76_00786 [bacterium ADurb.Bin429]
MNETAPTCAKHPKVTTYVRCAACSTPICDRCAVETAVGYKCRDCGTQRGGAYSPPSAPRALAAGLVGLAAGALGAGVLGMLGFWGIILAIPYGRFIGTLLLKASGRKVGLFIDILAGISLVLGGLAAMAGEAIVRCQLFLRSLPPGTPPPAVNPLLFITPCADVVTLIIAGVIAAAAISRLRMPWGGRWF